MILKSLSKICAGGMGGGNVLRMQGIREDENEKAL